MEEEKRVEPIAPVAEIWDNSRRAKSLIIVFSIFIVVITVAIFIDYLEIEKLTKIKSGNLIVEDEITMKDLIQFGIALLQFGLYITSAVIFIRWFRRAYGNLHRLGVDAKHKESMAVWYWFIPILCIYKPVQMMNEIWHKTQEKIKQYNSSYIAINYSLVIGIWWTLYLISNFIGRYLLRTAFKEQTVTQMLDNAEATLVSDIIQLVEALLVILIVSKMSKIEQKLATCISAIGGNIVYKK